MADDVLEQQGGTAFQAAQIGDRREFEMRIDRSSDALDLANAFGFLQPSIEAALNSRSCRSLLVLAPVFLPLEGAHYTVR